MLTRLRIAPCLWFNDRAEEAAAFYVSIFKASRLTSVTRYSETGRELHRREPGSVMTVAFELEGQPFTGLNGGPLFAFNEAISLQVRCDTQDEIDYYWDRLSEGGDPKAQVCGWLKDKFGVSWQVVPSRLDAYFAIAESPGARRAMAAMLTMKKFDLAAIERAFGGGSHS